ncbi:MAG: hypothetical protein JKY01_04895 [Pseudomonadales bacterium]|nr:hypothetical protein [Pseudomonadales bacterium]
MSFRGTLDYKPVEAISFQSHAVFFYENRTQSLPSVSANSTNMNVSSVERSGLFYEQHDDAPLIISDIDRFNINYSNDGLQITLGRQAINLSSTFYFSPNDFFAPFAANTFYRIYKPGVDAFRLDKDVDQLGQFTVIYALGFQADSEEDGAWASSVESDQNSLLLRYSGVLGNFGWSLLGGTLQDNELLGFGLQGEVFSWLGLRAEGNVSQKK